jgi:hypothetical protein
MNQNGSRVLVVRDGGIPVAFASNGEWHPVVDVIGRWQVEGRWYADGHQREHWRVQAVGRSIFDLTHNPATGVWEATPA